MYCSWYCLWKSLQSRRSSSILMHLATTRLGASDDRLHPRLDFQGRRSYINTHTIGDRVAPNGGLRRSQLVEGYSVKRDWSQPITPTVGPEDDTAEGVIGRLLRRTRMKALTSQFNGHLKAILFHWPRLDLSLLSPTLFIQVTTIVFAVPLTFGHISRSCSLYSIIHPQSIVNAPLAETTVLKFRP